MPLYQYRQGDDVREVLFHTHPPSQLVIDGRVFEREIVVPFAFAGRAAAPSMASEVMRGYREQEIIQGSRFHTKLPVEKIKRAWASNAPNQ